MAGGLVGVLLISLFFGAAAARWNRVGRNSDSSSRNYFTCQAFSVPLLPCVACFRWCPSCCPHLRCGFSARCGCLARPYGVRLRYSIRISCEQYRLGVLREQGLCRWNIETERLDARADIACDPHTCIRAPAGLRSLSREFCA